MKKSDGQQEENQLRNSSDLLNMAHQSCVVYVLTHDFVWY